MRGATGWGILRASPGLGMMGGGGVSPAASESAWYARAVALGASPPAATRAAVLAFFTSFYAAGFLAADFDYIYLLIGEAAGDTSTNKYNQKRVNLIAPGTFDATVFNPNASGHTAAGTLGDLSMYWLTGAKQSTIPDRSGNGSIGAVCTAVPSGVTNTDHAFFINHYNRSKYSGNLMGAYGGTDMTASPAVAAAVPSMIYAVATGTDAYLFENTTQRQTTTTDPVDVPDIDSSLFAMYNGTVPFQQSDCKLAFAWHGRGFASAGDRTAWYTIVQTLMAAFGVTI